MLNGQDFRNSREVKLERILGRSLTGNSKSLSAIPTVDETTIHRRKDFHSAAARLPGIESGFLEMPFIGVPFKRKQPCSLPLSKAGFYKKRALCQGKSAGGQGPTFPLSKSLLPLLTKLLREKIKSGAASFCGGEFLEVP